MPDDGRDAHDTAIVKTTHGQAIKMMRKKGISIDSQEEKMALQLFPCVRIFILQHSILMQEILGCWPCLACS
jgi:hypothetical protein